MRGLAVAMGAFTRAKPLKSDLAKAGRFFHVAFSVSLVQQTRELCGAHHASYNPRLGGNPWIALAMSVRQQKGLKPLARLGLAHYGRVLRLRACAV